LLGDLKVQKEKEIIEQKERIENGESETGDN